MNDLVERLKPLRDAKKGIDCVMSPMDREAIGEAITALQDQQAKIAEYDKALAKYIIMANKLVYGRSESPIVLRDVIRAERQRIAGGR